MYRQYASELKSTFDRLPWETLSQSASCLHSARMNNRQVFTLGNGGSASTASHFACDLSKNTVVDGLPRFRVMALTDNQALMSAYANDLGYENVFAEQLANFVQQDDIVVAISASGNSPNVLKAVKLAKEAGATTIGWSGYEGGQLAELVDISVVVENNCIEQIEDIHLMLGHMMTTAVRKLLEQSQTVLEPVY